MEFDQLIFKKLYTFWKDKFGSSNPLAVGKSVELDQIQLRLTVLARAISGDTITIVPSEREGGWSGDKFYLPQQVAFFKQPADNLNFYFYRVLYLTVQRSLNFNWEDARIAQVPVSQHQALTTSATVLAVLFEEFPVIRLIYQDLREKFRKVFIQNQLELDESWLYGRWMNGRVVLDASLSNSPENKIDQGSEITTEIQANASDEIQLAIPDQKQIEENIVHNNFEKVETATEFHGNFKDFDDEDSLNEQEEAIRQLNMKHVVRVDGNNKSIYKADFSLASPLISVGENNLESGQFYYDEWNYGKRIYKSKFCAVHHTNPLTCVTGSANSVLSEQLRTSRSLRRMLNKTEMEFQQKRRMNDGPELDLDACIDYCTDVLGQKSPIEKIYESKRKSTHDVSFLFLLDNSLSTGSYLDQETVLSIEKRMVTLLGEAFNEFSFNFQIDTFCSKTHRSCQYQTVKSFDENWSVAKDRIEAIEPTNYTRIGAALRHANWLVKQQGTRKKCIVILSDGKPNDYDTYEGEYGIADIKKALDEITNDRVFLYALAIEQSAKYYLPQMFGHHNYSVLRRVHDLPDVLGKILRNSLLR